MISSSGFGKPKTYDRLQIPNLSIEKRKTSGMDYLDALRSGEGLRSQTLKYSFDFQRPANARGRLAVIPGIVSVPNVPQRDARTGGPPAGAPGMRTAAGKPGAGGSGQAKPRSKSARRQGKTAQGSSVGAKQHPASKGSQARPSSGSILDFRGTSANAASVRQPSTNAVQKPRGSINAPRLKDSMDALGLPSKGQSSKGNAAASTASKQVGATRDTPKPAKGFAALLAGRDGMPKGARPPKRRPEPKPPSPKTIQRQQKLRGLDQSEPTVVGFDISRSVYQTPAQQDEIKPQAQAVKHTIKNDDRPRAKNVFSTIVLFVLVFFCLAFSLSLQERQSEVSRQNAELEKSIESLKGDVSKAKMAVDLQDDLGEIKSHAALLGLKSPDDEQIEYVDLGLENTYEEQTEPAVQVVSSGNH